jgi:hypothetical protein
MLQTSYQSGGEIEEKFPISPPQMQFTPLKAPFPRFLALPTPKPRPNASKPALQTTREPPNRPVFQKSQPTVCFFLHSPA